MNTASKIIEKLSFKETYNGGFDNEICSCDLADDLNAECVLFQELLGQDTWSFEDGSYITKNIDDDYFLGDDISEFELTASMHDYS